MLPKSDKCWGNFGVTNHQRQLLYPRIKRRSDRCISFPQSKPEANSSSAITKLREFSRELVPGDIVLLTSEISASRFTADPRRNLMDQPSQVNLLQRKKTYPVNPETPSRANWNMALCWRVQDIIRELALLSLLGRKLKQVKFAPH